MIKLFHVKKVYPGDPPVLDDITMRVEKGEFVWLTGPSGAGKSTLLKLLFCAELPSSGQIIVGGRNIGRITQGAVPYLRRNIGVVFQAPVLFPWRTVLDNVLLPIDVQGLGRDRFLPVAMDLLALVGLREFERRYPWELSGGMQQRVAITRALVHDPAMLLMDEPFGALDAMTREHMNLELQRIWMEKKKTVFFITHSIPEAVFLADRVLVMTPRPGRIVDDLAIKLPRPRSLDLMTTPEFGAYTRHIRALFNVKGGLDA